jgi:prolyl 4-hydroxylase
MGVPQRFNDLDLNDFYNVYTTAVVHLLSVAQSSNLYPMFDRCKNEHSMCIQWEIAGNCYDNGARNQYFMDMECCPVCGSAAQKAFLLDCPIHPDDYTAFEKPGDVTKHFERTIQEFPQYNPTVLARPFYEDGDSEDTVDYKIGPWIITLDGVATDEEMERLMYWGHEFGYQRSTDGGGNDMDGSWEAVETEDRTSSETFCYGSCQDDPIIKGLMEQIENITGIPQDHSDYLQLLYYTEGQFYRTHQDYHPHQVFSSTGARIVTFYTYLNDVEAGGGTNFPFLDLTIMPKKGRVAMWSNVRDDDPMEEHLHARHQALPVERGIKVRKYRAIVC